MSHLDYILYKAIALILLVAVVSFVYALVTGRTLEEARRDKQQAHTDPEEH